jgi:hypothetical protein
MAININAMKGAMQAGVGQIGQSLPSGYATHSHGQQPANPTFGDLWTDDAGSMYIYTQSGWVETSGAMTGGSVRASISSVGDLSVGNGQSYAFHNPPTNVIAIETKLGRVGVNVETGDITIPVGVGRDEAVREFWLGFQKHFVPSNKAKYEKEIAGLKRDYQRLETYYKDKLVNIEKDAAKPIIEKVRKKYGNEKFIMVKPEDLVKFIEEA